ncbi:ATP-binding protein [Streptomyces sp. NPDC088766]|uniref:ATP-binding protein n=1 Tax=Streptomyces sp. NPDC088766 TaxID=3365893 RepID=UPI0038192F50
MRIAEDGRPVATEVFQRKGASVRDARRFAAAILEEWELSTALADTAELVVSELATNAVLHAQASVFRVTLRRLARDQVRVAVIDRSRTMPTLVHAEPGDDHGRGLALVDALAPCWGTDLLPWGKRVWAELEDAQTQSAPPASNIPIYTTGWAQAFYVLAVAAVGLAIVAATVAQH